MSHIDRALETLRRMSAAAPMYASTREAFLSRVTGIMCVCAHENYGKVPNLYVKYAPLKGSSYLNLNKEVEIEWAKDVIDEAIEFIKSNRTPIEEAWHLVSSAPLIAGPWIPCRGKCYRYNASGQPIASVSSNEEIPQENFRLESLGYQLTDINRRIPEHFFKWSPPKED